MGLVCLPTFTNKDQAFMYVKYYAIPGILSEKKCWVHFLGIVLLSGSGPSFGKTQVTVNNLELQGATAAPPFHGATVTLAVRIFWLGQVFWKEKKSRKNEDPIEP